MTWLLIGMFWLLGVALVLHLFDWAKSLDCACRAEEQDEQYRAVLAASRQRRDP